MNPTAACFASLDRKAQLSLARQGTSLFLSHLGALSDSELDDACGLPGWSQRHLVAHVGYNAAALGRLMDWAATGVEIPMYPSLEARTAEIYAGARLSARQLRHIARDTAVELAEKWRRATDATWEVPVRTVQGRTVPARATVWLRTREVWIHTVDLNNGALFEDIPAPVLESLLEDVVTAWRARNEASGVVLEILDGRSPIPINSSAVSDRVVRGSLAGVVQWITGRGANGVFGVHTAPPRWL